MWEYYAMCSLMEEIEFFPKSNSGFSNTYFRKIFFAGNDIPYTWL